MVLWYSKYYERPNMKEVTQMNDIIRTIEAEQMKENAPEFHVGDTVKVYAKIREGNR